MCPHSRRSCAAEPKGDPTTWSGGNVREWVRTVQRGTWEHAAPTFQHVDGLTMTKYTLAQFLLVFSPDPLSRADASVLWHAWPRAPQPSGGCATLAARVVRRSLRFACCRVQRELELELERAEVCCGCVLMHRVARRLADARRIQHLPVWMQPVTVTKQLLSADLYGTRWLPRAQVPWFPFSRLLYVRVVYMWLDLSAQIIHTTRTSSARCKLWKRSLTRS